MRCIIYELKLTAGKIIHTQEGLEELNPARERWKTIHILLQKNRSEDSITVSALFMEIFSTKQTGEKI